MGWPGDNLDAVEAIGSKSRNNKQKEQFMHQNYDFSVQIAPNKIIQQSDFSETAVPKLLAENTVYQCLGSTS